MKNENFKKFEEFFSNTKADEILNWNKGNAFIEFDWMYSDLLERKYVKQAIANIMQKYNPTYSTKAKYRNNKSPEDIEGFSLIRKNGKIILEIIGADSYTFLDIYNDDNKDYNGYSKYNKILISDLNKEIFNVISSNKDLNESQIKLMMAGIEQATDEAFKNLIEYYKYLIEEKNESKKHICNIVQRIDNPKEPSEIHPHRNNYERKNEIIDFQKRKQMLEKHQPSEKIVVTEANEDGKQVISYISYVFLNSLNEINQKQDGYLFVCEPVDGDRSTRIMYLSQKQFNEFINNKNQDKLSSIVKHYLEMSNTEFNHEPKCISLSHTSPETYSDRLNFYIQGSKGPSLTNLKGYLKRIKKLYSNENLNLPYYRPKTGEDVKELAGQAHLIDFIAKKSITKNNEKVVE